MIPKTSAAISFAFLFALLACGSPPDGASGLEPENAAAAALAGTSTEPTGTARADERVGQAKQATCFAGDGSPPCGPTEHSTQSEINPFCPPGTPFSVTCRSNPKHGSYTTCDQSCAPGFEQSGEEASIWCLNGNGDVGAGAIAAGETNGLQITCESP
jgi:hypothetical protein